MAEVPFPAIDYTSRDYASIRQSMLDAIPARMPEWTSRSPQDFGVVLIELFATMGDVLSYYADRVASESFLSTATQRSSVLKLAQLLNYRTRGTSAAQTRLVFTVDGAMDGVIPAGTVVRSRTSDGSTPIVFQTDTAITVTPGTPGVTRQVPDATGVSATQGMVVVREQIGTAEGNQDETYVLLQSPVVESSVTVQVQENPPSGSAATWTFVDSLLDARPGDNVFTTDLDANGVLTVLFGDGVNGRVPPRSSAVLATYRVGGGIIGNVSVGVLTEIVDPVEGILSVTNPQPANGGADAESIESIRVNAPRSLQALNRAVTLADFSALALQVPQVAKARAEAAVYTHVAIYIAPFGGQQPPQRLLNDVVNYLAERKLVGVDVVAVSPTYVPIDVTVTVTVASAYSAAAVRAGVENALKVALAFDAVDFGQRISISDIYAAVTRVAGVSHASLSRLNRRGGVGVTDVILEPNEIPIPGTIAAVTIGGISGSDPTGAGTSGTVTAMPTASAAPVVHLSRCDPAAMHLEMSWTPGPNSTHWYIELRYLNSQGQTLTSTVVGPAYTPSSFAVDLAKNTAAVSVGIFTQAFNADVGPVLSPPTYIPNPCGT